MKSVIALLAVACLAACVYGQVPSAAGRSGISPALMSALARGGSGGGMNLMTLGLINGGLGDQYRDMFCLQRMMRGQMQGLLGMLCLNSMMA